MCCRLNCDRSQGLISEEERATGRGLPDEPLKRIPVPVRPKAKDETKTSAQAEEQGEFYGLTMDYFV
jgi:hypothetical protein